MDSKPVCRKCICEKLSDDEVHSCPVCNIDLARLPLEKLRPDHSLQDVRAKILPLKKRKLVDLEFTPSVSSPVEREEVRATSSSAAANMPTQVCSEDAKRNNRTDKVLDFCKERIVELKSIISLVAAMTGEALSSSPVVSQNLGVLRVLASNPIPEWSGSLEAYESISGINHSAMSVLQSIRSGIPLQDAKEFQKKRLVDIINVVLSSIKMLYGIFRIACLLDQNEKDILKALKQLEEKDVLVASLCRTEEEQRSIAEQAQIKQAQAESALREMQMKEIAITGAVEEAWNLAKQFQDILT
ncbi:hypothetical protein TorRG33x02_171260 [Trema orientale]|uniref:Uncharacterized protein n=1 Tax=Trema orientale TaxID=63057 RepID=A0A2P5ENQ1_TREOI|nr:hypothetical protein TorRG33x02_171260 [Trema orientale]